MFPLTLIPLPAGERKERGIPSTLWGEGQGEGENTPSANADTPL